jgi:hypothetical protein
MSQLIDHLSGWVDVILFVAMAAVLILIIMVVFG